MTELRITPAREEDLDEILALFDEAIEWLGARGLSGQWGTRPTSELPQMQNRFREWIERGSLFVARSDGELVGTVAVGAGVPAYAAEVLAPLPGPAFYLEAFATTRRHAGSGIGAQILSWAEEYTTRQGQRYLRLDCWADNPGLCAYYKRAGYRAIDEFFVGTWRGQLFEKAYQ